MEVMVVKEDDASHLSPRPVYAQAQARQPVGNTGSNSEFSLLSTVTYKLVDPQLQLQRSFKLLLCLRDSSAGTTRMQHTLEC